MMSTDYTTTAAGKIREQPQTQLQIPAAIPYLPKDWLWAQENKEHFFFLLFCQKIFISWQLIERMGPIGPIIAIINYHNNY